VTLRAKRSSTTWWASWVSCIQWSCASWV